MTHRRQSLVLGIAASVCVALASVAGVAGAQTPETPKVVTPQLDFSGVLYANYQNRSDSATKAVNGGKPGSKFDVERVYLTFRMPAGDRASIRVTTDVYSNTDATTNGFYKGWVVRIKYAYLQLNALNDIAHVKGLNAAVRFGMLNTVTVEHIEGFWPRYLGQVALERSGFFASSDVGGSVLLTLPKKMGEAYATITNGSGYTVADPDRFKDVGLRVSLTPLANSEAAGGLLKTFAVSPWIYAGHTASKFQNGGAGQVGVVSDGLTRNRAGLFVGIKDRRLSLGLDYGQRTETTETGSNTAADPRVTKDVTGRMTSAFAILRPTGWASPGGAAASWGVIGRLDNFKPNTDVDPASQFIAAGLFWEPNSRVTISLDAQNQSRKNGSTTAESKVLFLHWQVLF